MAIITLTKETIIVSAELARTHNGTDGSSTVTVQCDHQAIILRLSNLTATRHAEPVIGSFRKLVQTQGLWDVQTVGGTQIYMGVNGRTGAVSGQTHHLK